MWNQKVINLSKDNENISDFADCGDTLNYCDSANIKNQRGSENL